MATQRFFAIVSGLLGMSVLTACFHWMGHPPPYSAEYRYSNFLLGALSLPFAAAYLAVSASLGFFLRRAWTVALGMVLPWPMAFGLEVSASPSSHNLFPFEVVLCWLPALVIALLGAGVGKFLAGYRARHRFLLTQRSNHTAVE